MAQSKDPVLVRMRTVAVSKNVYEDLPALLALFGSLDYWNKRRKDPILCHNFVEIIFNPENFEKSYEELEEVCRYRERTIRTHCREYMERFSDDYNYLSGLSLPLLTSRYIEFCLNSPLRRLVNRYREFRLEELSGLISGYPAPPAEKELSLHIYYHFLDLLKDKAG